MANKKISDLTAATSVTSSYLLPLVDVDASETKKATFSQVLDYVTGSTINQLTASNLSGSDAKFTSLSASLITGSDAKFSSLSGNIDWSYVQSTPTTLAGYGITDAALAADAVEVGDDNTFTGVNTFSGHYITGSITGSDAKLTSLTASSIEVDTITAREYHTEVVSASIIYESGSTKFGDDSLDTHQFTGSILAGVVSGTTANFTTLNGDLDWSNVQSTPTTLSGYGITDAVTLDTEQTITGRKTFTTHYVTASLTGSDAKLSQLSASYITGSDVKVQTLTASYMSGAVVKLSTEVISPKFSNNGNPLELSGNYSNFYGELTFNDRIDVEGDAIFSGSNNIFNNYSQFKGLLTGSTSKFSTEVKSPKFSNGGFPIELSGNYSNVYGEFTFNDLVHLNAQISGTVGKFTSVTASFKGDLDGNAETVTNGVYTNTNNTLTMTNEFTGLITGSNLRFNNGDFEYLTGSYLRGQQAVYSELTGYLNFTYINDFPTYYARKDQNNVYTGTYNKFDNLVTGSQAIFNEVTASDFVGSLDWSYVTNKPTVVDASANNTFTGTYNQFTGMVSASSMTASFVGDGSGIYSLDASQLSTGTIPNARLDPDLSYIAQFTGSTETGSLTRISDNTWALREIRTDGTGLNITNGNGVSGHPTLSLTQSMQELASLDYTDLGFLRRYYNGSAYVWSLDSSIPLTGSLYYDSSSVDAEPVMLRAYTFSTTSSIDLFRMGTTDTYTTASYGFTVRYMRERGQTDNNLVSYSIFTDDRDSVNQIEAFTLIQDGKLGLGKPSPEFNLDVSGSSRISGSLRVGEGIFVGDSAIDIDNVHIGTRSTSTNLAFGIRTLKDNTTGTNNLGIGNQSLSGNLGGNYNTALGHESLKTNQNGSYNVGVGQSALRSINGGSYNIGIGAYSQNSGNGQGNTSIGAYSQYSGGGNYNASFGYYSLVSNTANYNVAIGANTLPLISNSGYEYNVAVGGRALAQATLNVYNNVAIGFQAGETLITASNNVLIGFEAGQGETSLSDTVIIKAGSNERLRIDSAGVMDVKGPLVADVHVSGTVASPISVTSYTLSSADRGKTLLFSSSATQDITCSSGLDVGYNCTFVQMGSGQLILSGASGVELLNRQSHTGSAGQYAAVSVIVVDTDKIIIAGDTV